MITESEVIDEPRSAEEMLTMLRAQRAASAHTPESLRDVVTLRAGERPATYIARLWNAMPCLSRKQPVTPETWDARRLNRMIGPWSSGERAAALFVLSVWCPREWQEFNLSDHASSLDRGERQVIAAWTLNPSWP